jgi:putative hemolysin
MQLGMAYQYSGTADSVQQAATLYERALAIQQRNPEQSQTIATLQSLASLYCRARDYQRAREETSNEGQRAICFNCSRPVFLLRQTKRLASRFRTSRC